MSGARDSQPQNPPVLTATEARAGRRGVHLIWVLVISLGLIVAIYAVMVGGIWRPLSQPGGQTRVDPGAARNFGAPPSPPRQSEGSR